MAKRVTVRVYGQKLHVKPGVAKRIRARKQTFKQPLLQPMQQLSGQTLQTAAHQLTNLQIKPQLSAIDRASSTAAAQGAAQSDRLTGYYRQLATEAQQGIARTAAIGQRATTGVQTAGREEQQALNSADQMVSGQEQTDAAVRGTGLQFGDRAREELAAAKAQAAQRTGTNEVTTTQYSQNFQDIGNAMAGATALRGGEAQSQLANMLANQQAQYRGQRQDIQSQKGNAYTKNLLDLRNTSFENQAVIQGLLGDQQKLQYQAQADAQNLRARFKLAKMSERHALEAIRLQNKLNNKGKLSPREEARLKFLLAGRDPKTGHKFPEELPKNSSGGSSGKNKPTAGEIASANDAYDAVGQIVSAHPNALRSYPGLQGRIKLANELKKGKPAQPATTLADGTKIGATPAIAPMPPAVVRAAMDLIYDKHLSAGTRKMLRARYPGLYRKLIKAGNRGPAGKPRPNARVGGKPFSGPHG